MARRTRANARAVATRISATQAARQFSSLIAQVRYEGQRFVIEKGGEPMCQVLPVRRTSSSTAAELARVIGRFPKPDAEYLKQVEQIAKRQPKAPRSPWG